MVRSVLFVVVMLVVPLTAAARDRHPPCSSGHSDCDRDLPRPPPKTCPADHPDCNVKNINIRDPLSIDGKLRGMTLLYFLERATDELERASLEKKTFVPRMVQSVDESL